MTLEIFCILTATSPWCDFVLCFHLLAKFGQASKSRIRYLGDLMPSARSSWHILHIAKLSGVYNLPVKNFWLVDIVRHFECCVETDNFSLIHFHPDRPQTPASTQCHIFHTERPIMQSICSSSKGIMTSASCSSSPCALTSRLVSCAWSRPAFHIALFLPSQDASPSER